MKLNGYRLTSVNQTGRKMIQIIRKYANDIGDLAYLPLKEYFYYIATLPYYKDPLAVEFVQRPKYSLRDTPFRDCDDKTILMASWAYLNNFPCRIVAVGMKRLSHVFSEFKLDGMWITMDATYPHSQPGKSRYWPKRHCFGVV